MKIYELNLITTGGMKGGIYYLKTKSEAEKYANAFKKIGYNYNIIEVNRDKHMLESDKYKTQKYISIGSKRFRV